MQSHQKCPSSYHVLSRLQQSCTSIYYHPSRRQPSTSIASIPPIAGNLQCQSYCPPIVDYLYLPQHPWHSAFNSNHQPSYQPLISSPITDRPIIFLPKDRPSYHHPVPSRPSHYPLPWQEYHYQCYPHFLLLNISHNGQTYKSCRL